MRADLIIVEELRDNLLQEGQSHYDLKLNETFFYKRGELFLIIKDFYYDKLSHGVNHMNSVATTPVLYEDLR